MINAIAAKVPPRLARYVGRHQHLRDLARRYAARGTVRIAHGPGKGLLISTEGDANLGYALGTTEPLVQDFLAQHLQPGHVFYDVGACVGFFSLIAARLVGDAGRVVAFEPFTANADALDANARMNRFYNVQIVRAALSNFDGSAVLNLGQSRLDGRLSNDAPGRSGETVDVSVSQIDSLDLAPPTVVKIDAEGAELDVLAGMRKTVAAYRPTIICEMHYLLDSHLTDVREALGESGDGYEVRFLESGVSAKSWAPHVVAAPR